MICFNSPIIFAGRNIIHLFLRSVDFFFCKFSNFLRYLYEPIADCLVVAVLACDVNHCAFDYGSFLIIENVLVAGTAEFASIAGLGEVYYCIDSLFEKVACLCKQRRQENQVRYLSI